jgi:hypothetical protein
LAEEKVADELRDVTGAIHGQIDEAFNKWRFVEVPESQDGKQALPPPPQSLTDWTAIAEKNGLKADRTGPQSLLQMRDTPLGKSRMTDTGVSLLATLFGERELDVYQPATAVNAETGDRYVLAKTSDTPGREPKLDEVHAEVVTAWKKQKAAELAQKHAEELAKKAQEANTPLTGFFVDNQAIKVVQTDPFARLTGGDVSFAGGQVQQQPYRFSQPSEIVAAGPEFLKRVFELKDGQVAVIPNHDHSIAYIVRVVQHQMSLAELRSAYLTDGASWMGENIMIQMRRQEVAADLERDIERSANLTWVRDPDKVSPGDQGEAG